MAEESTPTRTAGEAGWRVSRYNVSAKIPGKNTVAIANLFRGTCAEYNPLELFLLSELETLDEHHPIIERFAKRGIITKVDERAQIDTLGRLASGYPFGVGLTICPTMGCNFDCPYCFENHLSGMMSQEVQDDIVGLAERMLDGSGSKRLSVTWFGGEPLLGTKIIESLSKRLIKLIEDRGGEYRANIITNGYLLTQESIDMLDSARVHSAQVTVDGLREAHDATRHLAGGGPTFDRIIDNLRNNKIPFTVDIRHNVHEGNRDQVEKLSAFIDQIAEESGNRLYYYPAPVSGNEAADQRGKQVDLLCGSNNAEIGIMQDARRFKAARGHYCAANTLWSVGIDEKGNLHKCWESVDKPKYSFGNAHDWDPRDPFGTASSPDMLVKYLNTATPTPDDECRDCIWLPTCAGGCPHKRLLGQRKCVAWRDNPEAFVLALYKRIGEEKAMKEAMAEAKAAAQESE